MDCDLQVLSMKYAKSIFIAGLLTLTACNSGSDMPVAAAATENQASCGPGDQLDPSEFNFSWQQVGETIHGEAKETLPCCSTPVIGRAVEISSDGSVVLATIDPDIIRTYDLNDGGLVQSAMDLANSEPWGISLSGDGSTILRQVPYDVYGAGFVQVETMDPGGEWQFNDQFFGNYHEWLGGMKISGNGNMIAMSQKEDRSNDDTYNNGVIRTYARSKDGTWIQLEEILGENAEGLYGPITLSNDGSTMLVGRTGGIKAYKFSGGKWKYLDNLQDGLDDASSGNRIASISGNAEVFAVNYSRPSDPNSSGDYYRSVRLFRIEDGDVKQIGQELTGYYLNDRFGYSIELSCDGSIVTIGADGWWQSTTYFRAFVNSDDTWHQIGEDLTFSQPGIGDLALSADGKTVVIGVGGPNSSISDLYGELLVYKLVETPFF